ncbi:transmembrane receptor activity [Leptolyngbya boryana IAM M-101]|nr:transmembrane receptor activity [Leptolyngbya boryana IAM M-101]BAS63357.1 transmembrane receptor activity [Leptolyngbya boryana dg5]
MITPGSEWSREIDASLSSADIILLMVSSDFLASDYCWGIEIEKALQRHESGEACVIPVILRHANWQGAPFAQLQALPKNARPITSWSNQDDAFFDVIQGIRITIKTLLQARKSQSMSDSQRMFARDSADTHLLIDQADGTPLAENSRRLLETRLTKLHAEWSTEIEKVGALRQSRAIETNVLMKFQLEKRIQAEQKKLERLESQLSEIEQILSSSEEKSVTTEQYLEIPRQMEQQFQQETEEKGKPSNSEILPTITPNPTVYRLGEVFKASGVPTVTFVEPERFSEIKLVLTQSSAGIVLEGASGIGKTTALRKALDQVDFSSEPKFLSARNPDHVNQIKGIRRWHQGLVVIDDLHRLDANTCLLISDYLKYLADNEFIDRQLVVIGIPETAKRLINFSFDLALRVKRFPLGRVGDKTIENMIKKGEDALNIVFSQKLEIIAKANGSLNVAQLLCYYIALLAGIETTQSTTQIITSDLDESLSRVMEDIEPKFNDPVRQFVLLGGHNDSTSVTILEELAANDNGVLSLHQLRDSRLSLEKAIGNFLALNYLPNLYKKSPHISKFICFNQDDMTLVIDDPQLTFYLRQLSTDGLIQMANKIRSSARDKVFVSYSHSDEAKLDFLGRLLTHLKPLEREGLIDIWSDRKIKAGSYWKQEIEQALGSAKIALLLVSANFLASDFIVSNELPPLLAAASDEGTVIIPVILSPCRLPKNISEIQSANSPSKALTSMNYNEQEEVFATLVEIIEGYLGL